MVDYNNNILTTLVPMFVSFSSLFPPTYLLFFIWNGVRYISILKEEGLEISQPALDPVKSKVHQALTARKTRSKVHRSVLHGFCDDIYYLCHYITIVGSKYLYFWGVFVLFQAPINSTKMLSNTPNRMT